MTPEDPFGRRDEEETDAFGRPIEQPPSEPARRPPETPGRFLPPTDQPPDKSAWSTERAPPAPPGPSGYLSQAQAPVPSDAAEWSQRGGAALLDFAIRAAIIFAAALVGALAYLGGDAAGGVGITVGVFAGIVASLAYAPWMISTRNGQTVGHRVTDTRVVMRDGGRLGGGRAFVREVLVKAILFETILLWITFGIGPLLNYLWALWDDRNETLHDKMCGTRVVRS